jgi:hypothetical protein
MGLSAEALALHAVIEGNLDEVQRILREDFSEAELAEFADSLDSLGDVVWEIRREKRAARRDKDSARADGS